MCCVYLGKSTLLKAIALRENEFRDIPKHFDIHYVEQEVTADDTSAIDTVIAADVERTRLIKLEKYWMESDELDAGEKLAQIHGRLDQIEAYSAEARASAILTGLQFTEEMKVRATKDFSGGWRMRIALARALFRRPTLLLLDEPTNDIDLEGLAKLEDFVTGLRGGVVLVSHDREFLARCVTTVVELDLAQNAVAVYDGGYDAFLEERSVARRHAREKYEEFAATKADLVSRARTQREWSSQGVRNAMKKSPDNDKIRRAASTESSEKQAQKVRQMESRISRLDVVEEPRKEWQLQFSIGKAPRSSSVVATLRDAVVRQGGFTLGPVNLQLNAGERIGITGPNGAGKSTLLRLLLGGVQPDSGSAAMGASVAIGEIDQARGLLEGNLTLADAVEAVLVDLNPAEVRTLLAKFGLKADHTSRTVESLSPGERTRAALALLQARGVNLLVLDEPTNHLDLPAIEQLEEALEGYDGALLLVTHDRRLLENVRLDVRWNVDNGTVEEQQP
ncbi:MAG: ABC-F family ATP-binding cassette domain-containing protein [Pseudarthrobacter sp.]